MNKLLVGGLALVAMGFGGSAVRAADMPLKALPPPIPVYSWTGCHIGLDGGESYGRTDGYNATGGTTFNGTGIPIAGKVYDSFNLSGFIGGVYAGCDYQFAGTGWVFGLEGDWSFTNKEGQAFAVNPAVNPLAVGSLKERWVATARARLGYAVWDKTLFYVTGGAAWMKLDSAEWVQGTPQATGTLQTDRRTGWTVGAGVEYAVGYGWTIRSEYLYVQVPTYTTFNPGISAIAYPTNLDVKVQDHIFRAGMSYKFGWTPAVVAKY